MNKKTKWIVCISILLCVVLAAGTAFAAPGCSNGNGSQNMRSETQVACARSITQVVRQTAAQISYNTECINPDCPQFTGQAEACSNENCPYYRQECANANCPRLNGGTCIYGNECPYGGDRPQDGTGVKAGNGGGNGAGRSGGGRA